MDKITSFSFSKSNLIYLHLITNIILVKKTQEISTAELILCLKSLTNNKNDTEEIKKIVRNCELKNLDNIISEIYKRLIVPLYITIINVNCFIINCSFKRKIKLFKT